jgi:Mg-chelatase subunit ChlD
MKRYKGYQFKQAVEELTRKIAKEISAKIADIEWRSDIPTAGTNTHGDIYFADVADDATLYDIDVQRYVGFAVHELLHRRYTDFSVTGDNHYLDQLHNACEDAWIEHTGIDESLTGNIGGLLTALLDQMVGEANATVEDWADPRQYPFIFAVYLRRHLNCHVPVPEGLEPIIVQASKDILACQSSRDTLRVAEWIMSQLKGLPDTPPQPAQKPSKDASKGPSEPTSGEGQGEGSRLDQNPFSGAGKARAPTNGSAAEVEPTNKAPKGNAGLGAWSENASVCRIERHVSDEWLSGSPSVPARLRYEVKRLFDNSGMEEFQRNRRSGSLNVSALHKMGLTDKLFQRRHETDGIDSAVVICLDVSGSMFDDGDKNPAFGCSDRIVQAIMATRALLETLQKSQVATCVLTFGSSTAVVKPWSEHHNKVVPRLHGLRDGGGTNDYFAVRYAHKLLLNRPEQRKIAMVITDGQGKPGYVKNQCAAGERLGVTTIGIGIQMNVSSVYPNAVNVKKASDLGAVSFKQIKLAL